GKCEKFFRADDPLACKHCGATGSLTQITFPDSDLSPPSNVLPSRAERLQKAVDIWRAVRALVIAAPILVLACLLLFLSELRDDPRQIGASEIVRAAFTALVGMVFVVAAIINFRRAAKGPG